MQLLECINPSSFLIPQFQLSTSWSQTLMSTDTTRPPVRPPVIQPGSGNAIIINPCQASTEVNDSYIKPTKSKQRLNPVLECIRNVSKEFGDIIPDFQLGRTTCALFLRFDAEPIFHQIIFLWNEQSQVSPFTSRIHPPENSKAREQLQSKDLASNV